MVGVLDDVVAMLRERYGEEWGRDDEANRRFMAQAAHVLHGLDAVHLVGQPTIEDGAIVLRCWVDAPLPDLLAADQLAYEIFGLLSGEVFHAERRFREQGLAYPFVTGSPDAGHVGQLVFEGPHAADFAERFRRRVAGGIRYQA